jgi:hypothetical protein
MGREQRNNASGNAQQLPQQKPIQQKAPIEMYALQKQPGVFTAIEIKRAMDNGDLSPNADSIRISEVLNSPKYRQPQKLEWHTEIKRLDAAHNGARTIAIDDMKAKGWRHYLVVPSFGTMQEHYFDKQF